MTQTWSSWSTMSNMYAKSHLIRKLSPRCTQTQWNCCSTPPQTGSAKTVGQHSNDTQRTTIKLISAVRTVIFTVTTMSLFNARSIITSELISCAISRCRPCWSRCPHKNYLASITISAYSHTVNMLKKQEALLPQTDHAMCCHAKSCKLLHNCRNKR